MIKIIKRFINIFRYDDASSKYIWISLAGLIVRCIALTFLCKTIMKNLGMVGLIVSIGAFLLNAIIEKPFYKFTYLETGIFYSSGYNAILGSLLYLMFYIINIAVLIMIIWFYNSWIYYVVVVAYVVICLVVRGIVYSIRG